MSTSIGASAPVQSEIFGYSVINAFSLPAIDVSEKVYDELVERTLSRVGVSALFGESNSGKTFGAIDLAMSLGLGVKFLGREVDQSAVLYVAAEAPAGIKDRMRGWLAGRSEDIKDRKGFIDICPHQITLFPDGGDVARIIATCEELNNGRVINGELASRDKIGLVIIDTLARVSNGANENTEDMGKILNACQQISHKLQCNVLLVHHSGKDASRGMRGWSGMRAFIDTEILIEDIDGVHVAEITKQRDIAGKGDRFAYVLEPIAIGVNKWDHVRTTCFALPTNTPDKKLKLGGAEQMIIDGIQNAPMKSIAKSELVKACVDAGADKSNTYSVIKTLIGKKHIYEYAGKLFVGQKPENDEPF